MKLEDKILYHQIHPLKLLTDSSVTPVALYLLWRHKLLAGLGVAFLPPMVASYLILRYVDLEPYRRSSFGQYVGRYMTREMEAVRSIGAVVMFTGAWTRRAWLMPFGLVIVLLAWFRGLIFPNAAG
jgi:hypothetical protein